MLPIDIRVRSSNFVNRCFQQTKLGTIRVCACPAQGNLITCSGTPCVSINCEECRRVPIMAFKMINPAALGPPQGYSNGVLTDAGGRLLFVAGQVGWDDQQKI